MHIDGDGLQGFNPELILIVVVTGGSAPDVGVDCADQFDDLGLATGVLPLTLLLLGRHLHLPRKSLVFPPLPQPLNSVVARQLISLKLPNQKV